MNGRRVALLVGGHAAVRASGGGPIAARDVAEAPPATVAELLGDRRTGRAVRS